MSAAIAMERRSTLGVSVARGIASCIWLRNRVGLAKCFVFWLVLAALNHFVFREIFLTFTPLITFMLAVIANLVLAVQGFFLLSAFQISSVSDGALSGYPTYLLRMPARSEALAVWPMVFGVPVVTIGWVITDIVVVRPLGVSVDPFLAWVALTAAMFSGQAIVWSPFGGTAKLFIYVIAMASIAGLFACTAAHLVSHVVGESILAGICPLAAGLSVVSVKVSRTGHEIPINILRPIVDFFAKRRRPAPLLSSATAGQSWYDWKREGAPLPLGVALLFGSSLFIFFAHRDPNIPYGDIFAGINVGTWAAAVLTFMPYAAIMLAGVLGNNEAKHPQLLRLPISTSQILAVKLRVGALSVVAACGVLLAIGLLTALAPASDGASTGILGVFLWHRLAAVNALAILFVLAVYVLILFRARFDGLFAAIGAGQWVSAAHMFFPFIAYVGIGAGMLADPTFAQAVRDALPALVFGFACVKIVAGITVAAVNLRRRTLTPASITVAAVVWLACVALFAALWSASGLLQIGSIAVLIAGSILAIPVVRIGLTPLAIEYARHK